ncbi:hypothetical protein [Singulisphaera sp. PoT]|uniref:hypothetical protein n=1 Tax=Singulisphaera sp. PoT TaxID=3411797 RepID=UPI003BF49437
MPTRTCDCLECQIIDSVPERPYVARVRAYMLGCSPRYTSQAITEVVANIRDFGTVECCESVDDCDRAAVERLIPDAPIGDWIRHEAYVWATDECGYAENCGCESCLHEVANLEAMGAALA